MQPIGDICIGAGPFEAVLSLTWQPSALRRLALDLKNQVANLSGVFVT
jgi:hypothetical protein